MIDLLPDPPSPADDLATFNSKAGATVAAYPRMVAQINDAIGTMNAQSAAANDASSAATNAASSASSSASAAQQAASSATTAASNAGTSAGTASTAASAAASARQAAESARDQAQAAAGQAGGTKTVNNKSPDSNGAIVLAVADIPGLQSGLDAKLGKGQFGIGGLASANTGDCNNPPIGWVTGYFNGNANTPPGSSGATIHQIVSAQNYVTQYAAINSSGTGRTYVREQFDGTWGAWRQLLNAREPVIRIPGGGGTLDCSLGTDFFISMNGNALVEIANLPAGQNVAYRAELHVECYSGALTFSGVNGLWCGQAVLTAGKNYLFEIKAHPTTAGYALITQSGAHG